MLEWNVPIAAAAAEGSFNEMNLLLALILLGSGVYCLYTWLRLLVTKRLFRNGLLVPKEKKISDCADEEEYIRYIMPPLTVLALMTTAHGVLITLNDVFELELLPYPWGLAPLVLTLGAIVWYMVRNARANREYFGM